MSPYETYAHLRRSGRSFRTQSVWLIPHYRDVEAGLRESRLSARRAQHLFPDSRVPESARDLHETLSRWTFFSDLHEMKTDRQAVWTFLGPERLQRLPHHLENWTRAQIRGWRTRVVDAHRLTLELRSDFAVPLREEVTREVFALPASFDLRRLIDWSDTVFTLMTASSPTEAVWKAAVDAHRELKGELDLWCDATKSTAVPHKMGHRLHAIGASAEAWSDQLMLILITTVFIEKSWINAVAALMTTPRPEENAEVENTEVDRWNELRTKLRDQPTDLASVSPPTSLLNLAIQEALRLESPTQITSRVATQDFEFAEARIRTGDRVALLIGSANRDESIFSEASRLNWNRQNTLHPLTFGIGGKRCPGAWLSNSVLSSTLKVWLEEVAELQLSATEAPQASPTLSPKLDWSDSLESRRLLRLPISCKLS